MHTFRVRLQLSRAGQGRRKKNLSTWPKPINRNLCLNYDDGLVHYPGGAKQSWLILDGKQYAVFFHPPRRYKYYLYRAQCITGMSICGEMPPECELCSLHTRVRAYNACLLSNSMSHLPKFPIFDILSFFHIARSCFTSAVAIEHHSWWWGGPAGVMELVHISAAREEKVLFFTFCSLHLFIFIMI